GFFIGDVGAVDFLVDRPAPQHKNAIADREEFGYPRGNHDDAFAGVGETAHDVEDLGFGADIDTGGGFVHDQHVRVGAEPLGNHDLLWFAAGKQSNGSTGVRHLDLKFFQQILGQRLARSVGDERAALQLSE